ncbi:MAG TPA: DUF3488 and transglutaminase-like domain-containing protein [Acidimicrobiales bacterium]|nr:DUF3488 and transglutaminase-like domain-containing protein [Acidimicrobiales bacterium]
MATLALTALTAAAAAGMGRLFAGHAYLVPFLAAALVTHALMWLGRRAGAPLSVTAAVALAVAALSVGWFVLPGTTIFGLPGAATLDAARTALGEAWGQFAEVVAPAPVTDGFLVAGMAAIAVTAVLADWAAFRMSALFEAVLPSFTLFIFTATLGSSQRRELLVGLYVAALLLFLLVHQAGLLAASSSWFASRSREGAGTLLRRGAALGVVTVIAGLVVGPAIPGADRPPVLAWRDRDLIGDSRRTTVSPLVDIRGRLVNQSTALLFTVRSTHRAYWRLTSLDTFDGQIWSSDASHRPVRRTLPRGPASAGRTDRVVQEFVITTLSSLWLPAAYRPERVAGIDDVSYNEQLGSLITDEDTTNGLTYRVESAVPVFSATGLSQAAGQLTGERAERFRHLPSLSPRVLALARAVTSGAGKLTPYARALALQNFFRSGAFTYDLDVEAGHGREALDNFLFRTHRGYCEQFAGAYAVLARAAGLPARVAVGFTPGEPGPDGVFLVRGLNAHAWPEVYLAGAGWVAFEPTPGRGAPGAESYTGLPEAQARPESPSTATTAVPGTTAAPGSATTATATTATTAAPAAGARHGRSFPDNPVLRYGLLALVMAAAPVIAVPAAKSLRRRRRRQAAATGADRVLVAWAEANESLAGAGARREPSDTLHEHAVRAAATVALPTPAAGALRELAGDATAASYSSRDVGAEVAARAQASAALVEAAVRSGARPVQRVGRAIDPRPLVRS